MAAKAAFYDGVLVPLGGGRVMDFGEVIGYGVPPMPEFWIGAKSTARVSASPISPSWPDRPKVREFFDAALARGAEVLHEPRLWPEYPANHFGAFVRDPDGNNVEAVCHQAE